MTEPERETLHWYVVLVDGQPMIAYPTKGQCETWLALGAGAGNEIRPADLHIHPRPRPRVA